MAKHIHVYVHDRKAKDATNHLGEKEYSSYESWKRACREANASVTFEGNKEICNAKPGVGEWDGEKGSVYAKKTGDAGYNTDLATKLPARISRALGDAENRISELQSAVSAVKAVQTRAVALANLARQPSMSKRLESGGGAEWQELSWDLIKPVVVLEQKLR